MLFFFASPSHSNAFVQISFADEGPGAVRDCALGYDQDRDRLYIFGGKNGGTISNDTWYYDFASNMWGKPPAGQAPEHRFTMAFGVWDKSMYISTGEGPGKVFYNDVWRLVNVSFPNTFYKYMFETEPRRCVQAKARHCECGSVGWKKRSYFVVREYKNVTHWINGRDRAEPV